MGSGQSRKGHTNLANRKKSLSDGNLCESLRQYQASIRRKKVRDSIAARDLETPSIVGYLDRKENGGTWESCWCVLKDSSLYRYSSAVDEMTDDILLLHGFEVLRCPEVSGKEFAFELLHPDYPSELLAAANSEELSEWITKLKQATQHMSIEGLNLEQGSSKQFTDIDAKKTDENRVKHCSKQQLLQEVLQEKMRLEQSQRRKRKERSKLCNVFQNDDSPLGSAVSTPELSPDVVSLTSYNSCNSVRVSAESQSQGSLMEQSLREISHLRQRKASTQLKVETLQRQLTMSAATKQKPRRFKIVLGNKNQNAGKDKESSQLAPVDTTLVQKQLQTLQGELEKISSNLEAKKKIALGDLRAITETKPSGHKKKGSSNSNSNDDQQSIQSVRSSNGNVSSSNSSLNLNSKDSKRNSCGMSTSGVQNGNEERTQNSQRTKNELTRTASVDPPVVRHSWDTNKARTNDRSSATCQPIARDRAHTTPDDLTTRAIHGSSSCQSEIDPAVLAQISAFEELLQERLHLQ